MPRSAWSAKVNFACASLTAVHAYACSAVEHFTREILWRLFSHMSFAAAFAESRINAPAWARDGFADLFREVALVRELLEYMAVSLVDRPEQVEITQSEDERAVIYELRVAKEDLGKVIGRQGRTAKAMRVLLGAASGKLKKRSVLEILE